MALLMAVTAGLLAACTSTPHYPGYELIEKKFVPEVNAECYYLEHIKSGARVFKIAADDPNKSFSVGFKTVPESDAGTPHIMEHSVLNGSKNFPVKSPFDVLMKGSLNTFLNAMTGSDMTVYPVASMNDKDYFNLMHVYLDAVFNPLIYDDPRIFMQEGWHYELENKEDPITIKGVVYNEMKGAFSSPRTVLNYQINRHLFPQNGYQYSSGGYPPAIPDLSYEEFLNFHRRYYHPSNSYIFLYGNADLGKELAFIDTAYLAKYDRIDFKPEFPINPPFDSIKEVEAEYPVVEGMATADQTYLSLSFVIGKNTDADLVMSLQVLADVLVNQETAPVRLALKEAGIGKDVSAFTNDMKQNVFTITVQNANPEDKDAFRKVVMESLSRAAADGLDKEAVEGTLNRMEFRLREGNTAQKGLIYNMQALSGWMFASDPFLGLEWEKPLAQVKKSLTEPLLEDIIRTGMVDNPYGLLLVLEPKPGLERENMEKQAADLAAYKASLSDEQLDEMVKTTHELMAYQEREDSPEALATIPMLKLEDIGKEAAWYGVEEKQESGVPVLYHSEFTNQVVYMNMYFDMRVLPKELIPYARLLSEFLDKLDTENYLYGDLDKALNIHTGGFNTFLTTFNVDQADSNLLPKFVVSLKTTRDKVVKGMELTSEILEHSLYDNPDRMEELLRRHQSNIESRMNQNGMMVAATRISSYLWKRGVFNEMTGGADYYWFLTDLAKKFKDDPIPVMEKLEEVAGLLFRSGNLVAAVTCSGDDYPVFADAFTSFAASMPAESSGYQAWDLVPKALDEGFLSSSKVQYVIKGYDYKKLGYSWNGKMNVLNQVLSTDWLQTRIRVMGGAYGGFANIGDDGTFLFISYRDPNLPKTLENYDATPEYLTGFEADETAMTRYIIGTISGMDQPMTPSQKGSTAVRYYFEKTTAARLQQDRDEVLATTADDIRAMAPMVKEILDQDVYCVFGNEAILKQNKDLFKSLVTLQK